LVVGIALNMLAHARSRSTQTRVTSTSMANDEAASESHVLVVENSLLLGASIETLLKREMGLNMVGIAPGDEVALAEELGVVQPQAVVLDEATRLVAPQNLLALFREHPQLQMIVLVNTGNNWVEIYNKRRVLLTQAADLIDLIRHNLGRP